MNDKFYFMFTNLSLFYVINEQTMLFVFGLRFCTLWLKTSDLLRPQNTKYQISTIQFIVYEQCVCLVINFFNSLFLFR